MTIAEVEASNRRLPAVYERARRRQVSQFKTRDAAFAYLTTGMPQTYRAGASRDHGHGSEWLAPVPAYRYARGQLARLAAEHSVTGLEAPSDVAYHRMLHALRDVLAEDSVFPTMSIDDDGGIIAEWRIGNHSLEIDVDPEGGFSFTTRLNGRRLSGGQSQTPLRKIIRDVSAIVAQVNPNWRSLFQHASVRT